MSSKQAEVGDFVFWEYSSGFGPKTYLGGIVTELGREGRVAVKGYQGYAFKPVFVTNAERGAALYAGLKRAEERRDQAVKCAHASFEAARDSLITKD